MEERVFEKKEVREVVDHQFGGLREATDVLFVPNDVFHTVEARNSSVPIVTITFRQPQVGHRQQAHFLHFSGDNTTCPPTRPLSDVGKSLTDLLCALKNHSNASESYNWQFPKDSHEWKETYQQQIEGAVPDKRVS